MIMPTGYTADVESGKMTDFVDFAMRCAMAFGALITMRDDPMDAHIPDEIKPYPWQKEQLEKAKKRLAEVQAMTLEECEAAALAARDKSAAEHKRWIEEATTKNTRYWEMMKQVEKWTPPTPNHEEMKNFMQQQLQTSMYSVPEGKEFPLLSGEEWKQQELARVQGSVEYYTQEWSQECARAEGRTEWIRDLKMSLAEYKQGTA